MAKGNRLRGLEGFNEISSTLRQGDLIKELLIDAPIAEVVAMLTPEQRYAALLAMSDEELHHLPNVFIHSLPSNIRTEIERRRELATPRVDTTVAPSEATLIDVLIDGFEKNEVSNGWHVRQLPLRDEETASEKFAQFVSEARSWKGPPEELIDEGHRRRAHWHRLEIIQAGLGLMIRVRAPRFGEWWHKDETWSWEPMNEVDKWLSLTDHAHVP
ncbi:MAG: hypothetical protein AAFN07_16370 [Pseudomonadota bacterium]